SKRLSRIKYTVSPDIIEFENEIDSTFEFSMNEHKTKNANKIKSCIYCSTTLIKEEDTKKIQICPNCGEEILYCEICKDLIQKGDNIVQSKICKHIFHKEHILEWIHMKNKCPICKESLNEEMLEIYTPQKKE
ncbi:MAG: hypothetical protein KGD64_14630, partial [Candidatus Heimdallarchaeota archaeon]|nr:hypothetical protein [Candidatus Heimdallarchaeota archaeon]